MIRCVLEACGVMRDVENFQDGDRSEMGQSLAMRAGQGNALVFDDGLSS